MWVKYSPTTRGFYVDGVHDAVPGDAVEITRDEYLALMNQSDHEIVPSEDGRPTLVERTSNDDYAISREAAYRAESDPLFFKEQRGEVPPGTWLDKVGEIKERFPK